ncbi:MAG: permease-like cell division protein FtsX [Nocardioidaceae bacterium]
MQIKQVFVELGTGLKRNMSMTVSLILTTFVSLVLVGVGLMIWMQSDKTEQFFGDRLQLQVVLCADNSTAGTCLNGAATTQQQDVLKKALTGNPEVQSIRFQTSQESYDKAKQLYDQSNSGSQIFSTVRPSDFPNSYFVTLKDPRQFSGVESQVKGMQGVAGVLDLHEQLSLIYSMLGYLRWGALGTAGALIIAAILQVSNTIRLAAFARRREIGIMRLVGASSWHIQLPFVLESLLAAFIAGVIACGALAAFTQFIVIDKLREHLRVTTWVGWHEALITGGIVFIFAALLALIPTLVMTRRYLDV